MAAGAPGAAGGKALAAALRPEPRVSTAAATVPAAKQSVPGHAAGEPATRRGEAASAGRAAAKEADSNAQARARDAGDAADRRSAFSAALDKARKPAQAGAQSGRQASQQSRAQAPAQQAARQAAQQAANATSVSSAAEAASAGLDSPAMRDTVDATPGDDKATAVDGAAGDSVDVAGSAVASMLGWLQPVQPGPGRHSTTGDGTSAGGDAQDAGAGDGPGGIQAVAAAGVAGLSGYSGGGGAGGGAQAGAVHAASVPGDKQPGNAPGAADAPAVAAAPAGSRMLAATAEALAGTGANASTTAATNAPADASAGASAYASRYSETKPAIASPASAQAAQSAGFDASQSIRTSAAALATPVERSVPAPMGDRHWARALSNQVLLLANHKVESATLRLSPEHTGPVEVRIQMQDSAINLAFNATQADTRAALEQALPQLRAAFAGAGLALGQATVGQQMRQGSQFSNATPNGAGLAADHPEATAAVIRPVGLLDEYA